MLPNFADMLMDVSRICRNVLKVLRFPPKRCRFSRKISIFGERECQKSARGVHTPNGVAERRAQPARAAPRTLLGGEVERRAAGAVRRAQLGGVRVSKISKICNFFQNL